MNAPPHFCYCWDGRSQWPIRPEDRFCGQCGRRLRAVEAEAPVVSTAPPVAVVYLAAAPGAAGARRYTGRLWLRVRGLYDAAPMLTWTPSGNVRLAITGFHLASPSRLAVAFEATTERPLPAGAVAEGRLTLTVRDERFDFLVQAYATAGLHAEVHPALRPGTPLNGSAFVLFRGAESATTILDAELGAGVPVQWEAVACDHPAVTVRLLEPERAAPRVRAEVRWDPDRLRQDVPGIEVEFSLRLRQLPALSFRQRVWWRLQAPLACRPAALVVTRLAGERPQVYPVHVSNLDRQPLLLNRVESTAPWVAGPDFAAGAGLRIDPGGDGAFGLELRPAALNGAAPPYQTRVALHFAGRGRQFYMVRVESVRRTRPLPGPLLLDPGPPRVVLGRFDEETGRVVYLRCSGDAGLAPERLGWTKKEYARAVYSGRPTDSWFRLTRTLRERLPEWEQLQVGEIRVCHHPWMADMTGLPGLSTSAWADLCPRPEAPRVLVRLGAWGASLVGPAGRPFPADAVETGAPLGVDLVLWLMKEFRLVDGAGDLPELRDWLRRPAGASGEPPGRETLLAGVRLSCEELLVDYRWGMEYAWRRLLASWRELFPATRKAVLSAAAADGRLRECLGVQGRRLAAQVRQRSAALPVLWICPLFAGRGFAEVIRSAGQLSSLQAGCLAPSWIEWQAGALRRKVSQP